MKYLMIIILIISAAFKGCEPGELEKPDLIGASLGSDDMFVTIKNDSTVADNASTIDISLKISDNLIKKSNEDKVKFSISSSSIGTFNDGKKTAEIIIDHNKASISVKSSDNGKSIITATIGTYSKNIIIQFYKPQAKPTITVETDKVEADNYHTAVIKFVTTTPDVNKKIIFVTDKGLFSNNSNIYTTSMSSGGTTRAYLRYNKVEIAKVKVEVEKVYSEEVDVTFIVAKPTAIIIEFSSNILLAKLGSKTEVKARLVRDNGIPSEGQIIQFSDYTDASSGKSIGDFFNTTKSNSLGEVTAEYSLRDSTYKGIVYIEGKLLGTNTKGSNRIFIK